MGANLHEADGTSSVPDGAGVRIGVVCGRFNSPITNRLLDGANRGFAKMGVAANDVVEVWVPGAFEIPFAAQTLLRSGAVDAVIGLGAVIRGETSHYDFVAGECARGLQSVQLTLGAPVVFGVLTTENEQQALDRSQGEGGHNVGEEGAMVAVEMVRLTQQFPPAAQG